MVTRLERINSNLFNNGSNYAGLYTIDFEFEIGDKILDVGGGNKPYPQSTHIIDMVDTKEQRHGKEVVVEGRKFYNGDVVDILSEFEDNHFDFCYSSHTFEHITNLPKALDLISSKCKRGFYALPASDFEFLTAKSHFGHVNLCRLVNGILHITTRPPYTIIPEFAKIFEEKLFKDPVFNKLWEGHSGSVGYRYVWESRFYWEDTIKYKIHEEGSDLYPQLDYFKEEL